MPVFLFDLCQTKVPLISDNKVKREMMLTQRLAWMLLLWVMTAVGAVAQDLTVREMRATNDISASRFRRTDLNGDPCALVKVRLAAEGAKFEGNVIPPVEYHTGEYWVYMTAGSKELHVKHPKYLPLEVHFDDYGNKGVKPLTTYVLTLAMPAAGTASSFVVNYKAQLLRNGTDDCYADSVFQSGDALYLSFQSPVSGFVAVYLLDADGHASCLLPYQHQQEGIYAVMANQHYVFFNRSQAPHDDADEYVMTCDRDEERNEVYVVFSPNQFVKALDYASERTTTQAGTAGLPRELNSADFQRWLDACQQRDGSMVVKRFPIVLQK